MTTLDTVVALSLQAFAIAHTSELDNALPFAHLVTAALNGEEFAIDRVSHVIALIAEGTAMHGQDDPSDLRIIRATDCTRPDGAISRAIQL